MNDSKLTLGLIVAVIIVTAGVLLAIPRTVEILAR